MIPNELFAYLYKLISKKSHRYITRVTRNDFTTYQCRTDQGGNYKNIFMDSKQNWGPFQVMTFLSVKLLFAPFLET